ncbi:type I-E CRISPR-associated protein Cas5/CasD [Secundilactobacillus kimchicus]|uniref:type I-E CRISPR-associated protein Cas5/CasD n=1 Tax=Secundilactobacillus kimchicus TaxID=528209 RepID=UPI0024A8F17F|nr:type I-E CRISPR-associated protein Cas5/CasD [Secundilactobacillus kimchicus]
MKTLTLRLTSPLQSYGNQASFSRRTTATYPSKSAVIGLISAALGYQRTDPRIQALNELAFAVRIDQPGRTLTDFQTVEWKKNTRKVTYRDYLQDAVFVVAFEGDDEQIEKISDALRHPVYQLYLGRRANVPAGPLSLTIHRNSQPVDVLKKMEWQASTWYKKRQHEETITVELIADAKLLPNQHEDLAKDRVISFDQRNRQLDYRPVVQEFILLKNDTFRADSTFREGSHDAIEGV